MDRARIPGLLPGRRHPDWHELYARANEASLPWYFPTLDPDIESELTRLEGRQKILDVGCGLGNQARCIAELGHTVVGTDISAEAIRRARVESSDVTFLVDDICQTQIDLTFDLIVDRGCFHVLEPETHADYRKSIHRLLKPNGILLLKVLSLENGNADFGPLRFSLPSLTDGFADSFHILKLRRTIYQGNSIHSPRAWFGVFRKKEIYG